MKISYLELVNNKRIFNGLGLERLELSFEEDGVYRFIGHNGCGKSTIMSCLNPLPESPDDFINRSGHKKIKIEDRDNRTIYTIVYEYGGNKSTCSIIRECDSGRVEMNPSMNIKSARDIIMDVFNLDNNYETLTTLSGYGKKSLAMMRPSERKAFVSYILTNVQVYNGMFKTLSKRSSIFRSMINSINGKIQYITGGNSPESIGLEIANQEKQREDLNAERDKLMEQLGKCNLTGDDIRINDARKVELQNAKVSLDKMIKDISNLKMQMDGLCIVYKIPYPETQKDADDLRADILEKVEGTKTNLRNVIDRGKKAQEELIDANDKINTIKLSDAFDLYDFTAMQENEHNKDLDHLKELTTVLQLADVEDEGYYTLFIDGSIERLIDELEDLKSMYNPAYSEISGVPVEVILGEKDLDKAEFFKKKHMLYGVMKDASYDVFDSCIDDLDIMDRTVLNGKEVQIYYKMSKRCLDHIDSLNINTEVLYKLFDIKFNHYRIITNLDTRKALEIVNYAKEREALVKKIESYNEQNEKLENKKEIVKELRIQQNKVASLAGELDKLKIEREALEVALDEAQKQAIDMSIIRDSMMKITLMAENRKVLETTIKTLEGSIVDTSQASYLLERKSILDRDIRDLGEKIYTLRHSLNLIVDYMSEMDEFKDKYDYIETLRKYCNPNTTGIQVVFASLYMNKILSMANSLLQNLFSGEYVLQPFIINENEFRIPVQGNGLLVDDVSSMSSSQIAMINMCLSLAILSHSSVKYRIPKFDEIDGALDGDNRCLFPNVLMNIMSALGSEQAFIVTHNNEFSDDYFKNIYLDELSIKR